MRWLEDYIKKQKKKQKQRKVYQWIHLCQRKDKLNNKSFETEMEEKQMYGYFQQQTG